MLETLSHIALRYGKVESMVSCQIVKYATENQWVLSILQCVIYSTIVYSFLYYITEPSYNTNNGSSNKQQPGSQTGSSLTRNNTQPLRLDSPQTGQMFVPSLAD